MSLIVKICGLSTCETLDVALDAGADMVGFVFFPPSPRHLSLETARDLGHRVERRASKVALTVDADDATLANIVEALQPDLLQLHGKETVTRLGDIKRTFGLPVMKAIAVETSADLAPLPGYAAIADSILFDARAPKDATRPGGLGAAFDHRLAQPGDAGVGVDFEEEPARFDQERFDLGDLELVPEADHRLGVLAANLAFVFFDLLEVILADIGFGRRIGGRKIENCGRGNSGGGDGLGEKGAAVDNCAWERADWFHGEHLTAMVENLSRGIEDG